MQIDENLLSQVSDFLKTSEGAEIVEGLKKSLASENGSDLGSLSSLFGGAQNKQKSVFDDIDMTRLIPLVSAISSAKTDDRATNLLLALKPLLSRKRQGKIDHAVSIMKIMALLPILEEHGFKISDIFS